MYDLQDNIVALATIPGKSALNVVRCSGPGVVVLYKNLTGAKKTPRPNFSHLKTIYYNNIIVDELMIIYFKSPKSFTGQNMLEFSVHGGFLVVKKIISIIETLGFRQAMPGEYSYRAFINGKIDLIQAEAISSIIDSGSNLDVMYSLNNLKGGLSKTIDRILHKLENIIIHIEHELDFVEDEIDYIKQEEYIKKLTILLDNTKNILNSSYLAHENKSNLNVCLIGRTNAGKSSLFNRLLGYDRSIVTKKKGTTRDTVEVELLINDINVTLIDTAGIRKTKEIIEKEGVSRTYNALEKSDIILFIDEKNPNAECTKYKSFLKNKTIILVQSKIDLFQKTKEKGVIGVSSTSGKGIATLFTGLSTMINDFMCSFKRATLFLINNRQKKALIVFVSHLKEAIQTAKKTKDLVLLASVLRKSHEGLSVLTQDKDRTKIINEIFRGFCVGK